MKILGINASHNATACLLVDGEIKACISEERLTKKKNQSGIPHLAIDEILQKFNGGGNDLDLVVFGFMDPKVNASYAAYSKKELEKGGATQLIKNILWWVKENALTYLPFSREIYESTVPTFYNYFVDSAKKEEVLGVIEKKLKIHRDKIVFLDHHTAHAYSAYYSSPGSRKLPKLVLTLDGMGDGLCSTVSLVKNGKWRKLASTPAGASIGDLYSFIAQYMGMKMGEHEYKVMGLAPYASERPVLEAYTRIKDLVWVNSDLSFGSKVHTHVLYKVLPKRLSRIRFDSVAGAIQKLAEELLCEWVVKCVKRAGVHDIVVGGGVFMNVKANQKIAELPEVNSLFVMPSCGDESTAIGAAYWGWEKLKKDRDLPESKALSALYLGGEFTEEEIGVELSKKKYKKYKVRKSRTINTQLAKLLSKGEVVARFSGRMEWGARSLGNRSILANPSNLGVIRVINEQIKSRDFWMPFAPSILKEKSSKYIRKTHQTDAPYMIITFDSTDEGRDKFCSATHQYDFSLRPQLVEREWNPEYWDLISRFEKLTGIGGVLNTSFNLHGFPVVYSPADAMHVFENSGLKHVAIGNYLVSKK